MGALRIGLTGGICCGKSTALDVFARHGFESIDLGRYLHEALQGSDRIKVGLLRRFGDECVDPNSGQVLTDRLAGLLNQDESSQNFLENLIHPELERLLERDLPVPSVVEIPLLFEQHMEGNFDYVLCIYATQALQLERAIHLGGLTVAEFYARLGQQMPLTEKILHSNFVIGNNGTMLQFERQIQQFLRHLTGGQVR
ncbi:MAG: dephospho-CoA kinase [Puniceicoccales bacterium]|nr:dephospho-CoA kinase [Puniceicoccales bacterium]